MNPLLNKIILCTGPSFGRAAMLQSTVEKDLCVVPYKKIFLSTNDPKNLTLTFNGIKPRTELLTQHEKQLDCINCIISSIKNAVNDPECLDDDIILFKHESVYISDMYLVQKALGKIAAGYDCVIKYWIGTDEMRINRPDLLPDYYHSDSFYIKVAAARPIFKDRRLLSCFTIDYKFCEEYLTKYLINQVPRVYKIDYHHSSWYENELGLFHIPNHPDPPEWIWNKHNYYEIYK